MGNIGHAMPEVVSHRLPTAAAQVQAWIRACGICGGQSGNEAGFLQVLQSALRIRIPPIAPQSSSSIIWVGAMDQTVAAVPSGLSLTP
jgi:hypothetical protein